MAGSGLQRKMVLRSGVRAAVLNAPDGFLEELGQLPEGVELDQKLKGKYDWIQLFVRSRKELEGQAESAIAALKPVSRLWITFPKGTSGIQTDLTRDQGWDILRGSDLKWVNLISVDETWSAFALRPYKPGEARQSFR